MKYGSVDVDGKKPFSSTSVLTLRTAYKYGMWSRHRVLPKSEPAVGSQRRGVVNFSISLVLNQRSQLPKADMPLR